MTFEEFSQLKSGAHHKTVQPRAYNMSICIASFLQYVLSPIMTLCVWIDGNRRRDVLNLAHKLRQVGVRVFVYVSMTVFWLYQNIMINPLFDKTVFCYRQANTRFFFGGGGSAHYISPRFLKIYFLLGKIVKHIHSEPQAQMRKNDRDNREKHVFLLGGTFIAVFYNKFDTINIYRSWSLVCCLDIITNIGSKVQHQT